MDNEFHISSLVVHAVPSKAPLVEAAIARLSGAEISARTIGGRIIVTLETNGEAEFMTRFGEIDRLPGVVATMLVFHQVETVESG